MAERHSQAAARSSVGPSPSDQKRIRNMDAATQAIADRAADRETWSSKRTCVASKLESSGCQNVVGLLILLSSLYLMYQTNARAAGYKSTMLDAVVDRLFSVLYIIEMSFRLYVYRSWFFNPYLPGFSANMLDGTIVVSDIVIEILSHFVDLSGGGPIVSLLRLLRMFRLTRLLRILRMFDKLREFLKLYGYAVNAIVWATCVFTLMLIVWGVLGVELVHPLNETIEYDLVHCERCPRAFGSILDATLTLLILVVGGDGWSALVLPLVERQPLLMVFFGGVLTSVQIGMMNLMIAMIVSSAENSRQDDIKEVLLQKEMEFEKAAKSLSEMFKTIDEDGTGEVTLRELTCAFRENADFREVMLSLDVVENDLELVFQMMDGDRSGQVTFEEFINQLHKLRTQDTHAMLIFIRAYLTDVRLKVTESMNILKGQILDANNKSMATVKEQLDSIAQTATMLATDFSQVGQHITQSQGDALMHHSSTSVMRTVISQATDEIVRQRTEGSAPPLQSAPNGAPLAAPPAVSSAAPSSTTEERTRAMLFALQDMINIANELQILDESKFLEMDGRGRPKETKLMMLPDASQPSQGFCSPCGPSRRFMLPIPSARDSAIAKTRLPLEK